MSPAFTMWAPSDAGELADLAMPGKMIKGVYRSLGISEHTISGGQSIVVQACTLPLTGACCIDHIVTTLAVMEVTDRGLCLVETVPA